MRRVDAAGRIRGVLRANPARTFRDRHTRRARELVLRLDVDDDEVVVRPWELRLPRTVIMAAARSRGLEPVGGERALVDRGLWSEAVRFTRIPRADAGEPER